ncbi:hypothetical protein PLICRDRAFT_41246 [Plicaturopsis crispa FD-325 SS-3]|nr:hypothetical protein PLICRDRAFT_41246 [Plicaturopsis crispa FD-325 SS-3]
MSAAPSPPSATTPVKILTVGPACGSIRALFAKVKAIDAKHGKFDFVLCTGDFFGPLRSPEEHVNEEDDEIKMLLEGRLEVPLECYIMQGEHPLPESVIEKFAKAGGQLCQNVFLLHKSGIFTTAHGLRIACLGGIYDPDVFTSAEAAPGFSSPFFSTQTVERLLANTLIKSTPAKTASKNYTSLAAIRDTAAPSQLVDVLLSTVPPDSISHFASPPSPTYGVPPLDDIVRKTKPRYHFTVGAGTPPAFWERPPFVWDDEQGRITRYVGLGAFGGDPGPGKKQRWFYAFSITPQAPAPVRPANATKNPFTEAAAAPRPPKRPMESGGENYIFGDVRQPGKRARTGPAGDPGKPPPGYKCKRCESSDHFINDCPERTKPPEGYICKICNTPGHLVRDCPTRHAVGDTGGRKPREGYVCRACGSDAHLVDDCPVASQRPQQRGGRRGPPKEIAPDECWFCLSNPNLAKHLIVSIGSECYLTLPKGQIIPTHTDDSDRIASVPGGGHLLIVPITHYPTLSTIPPDLAPPILEENEKYKTAIRSMYAKHGCVPVFFEVGRLTAKGGHAHVQVVPVPRKLEAKVEGAFMDQGRAIGVDFEGEPDEALEACAQGGRSYFRVDLPDGKKMVHVMKDGVPFSIQFGRQVLVQLLAMPERMDWKACMLSEEDDRADAQAFKAAFAPFDPTM